MQNIPGWLRTGTLLVYLGLTGAAVYGCDDGRFENAGEKIDDAGDEMEDEIDELEDRAN